MTTPAGRRLDNTLYLVHVESIENYTDERRKQTGVVVITMLFCFVLFKTHAKGRKPLKQRDDFKKKKTCSFLLTPSPWRRHRRCRSRSAELTHNPPRDPRTRRRWFGPCLWFLERIPRTAAAAAADAAAAAVTAGALTGWLCTHLLTLSVWERSEEQLCWVSARMSRMHARTTNQ